MTASDDPTGDPTAVVVPPMPDLCWPVDVSCCSNWAEYDPEVQDRAVALATSTLRALSGYRVGGCPKTVRPCRQNCAQPILANGYDGSGVGYYPTINVTGQWVNVACGCGAQGCACTTVCEVPLPPPVASVQSVQIGTQVIPETWYRVDNGSKLTWQGPDDDDDCGWPLCQDMSKPVGEEDTFAVTYLNALPVDALASYAAGVLACEFVKACSGQKCRLPTGVTSVARQGVAFTVGAAFDTGRTGIPEVDAWLRTVNPKAMIAPSRVWSPDLNEPRVTTWASP